MFPKLHAGYIFNSVNLEFQRNLFCVLMYTLLISNVLLYQFIYFIAFRDVLNQFFVYHKQMPHFLLLLDFVFRTNMTSK